MIRVTVELPGRVEAVYEIVNRAHVGDDIYYYTVTRDFDGKQTTAGFSHRRGDGFEECVRIAMEATR